MSNPAQQIKASIVSGESLLRQIPTDDAEAALQFCRALAGQIAKTVSLPDSGEPSFIGSRPTSEAQDETEPEVSIVIPVYNEVENLVVLYDRLVNALEEAAISFEVVFVDDGSTD